MNKIFYGLVAFGDIEKIIQKIQLIYKKENYYLIHYNKRDGIKKYLKLKRMLQKYSNVKVVRKFRVYRAHYSILKTHLYIFNEFLKSNYDIVISMDNKTIPINLNNISINDNEFYLNLERKNCLFYTDKYWSETKKIADNISDKKFYWWFYGYFQNKWLKKIFILIISLFLIKRAKNKNEWFIVYKKIKLPKVWEFQYGKKSKLFKHGIKNEIYQVAGNYLFTKNQIKMITNHPLFKKWLKYVKDKASPEETALHSFIKNKIKFDKTHIGSLYIASFDNKAYDTRQLSNFNLNDYIFIRYSDYDLKKIIEYLKINKSVNLKNLNL